MEFDLETNFEEVAQLAEDEMRQQCLELFGEGMFADMKNPDHRKKQSDLVNQEFANFLKAGYKLTYMLTIMHNDGNVKIQNGILRDVVLELKSFRDELLKMQPSKVH